ncbi:MAG: bifunctional metallophosphatase/5'-nucleotidase [Polaribacter sp.]|nr:bifunctional metallophosphatase/5'-nucleotidase [Polaribacter sp.]MDG1954140.1 bifunctional metallophosphatase/5'-nucleotidase [Polaribacter sp.]MDG2073872.1 bifunctional metallophosphatase/5'-nucleotidase [Polaribacter sp.]
MKSIKSIFYFLSILLFLSCNQDDGKIGFTFLQLNDVYEIAPIQGGEFGGMARVETVHQELLKENKNTLLLMAGDFLNPSLLGTVKYNGERIRGKQMIETMNAMNFDLVAFGNHEFDLSANDLQKRLDESNFDWITSNVLQVKDGKTTPFTNKKNKVNETYIKEFTDSDGTLVRVGFISVCVPSNPKSYVKYKDVIEEVKRSYNELKDKVDVVFGLTHLKITDDKKIAELLQNIPLIMGGHEHTNMMIPVGNSFVAKADANAKTAYIHRISYDKKTKKASIKSELKEINNSIIEDASVGAVVNKWQTILKKKIKEIIENPDEVILKAKISLDGRDKPIRSMQTNLGELITKSMSFAFDDKVDCALVNGGSIRIDDELEGNITPVDIFRVLPYGGAVLKVKLKGSLLQKVLDYGVKATGTGAYLQRYNIQKTNNKWLIQNKSINPNKIYTVAFSDYLLKGFDIPFLSEKNKNVVSVYNPKSTEISYDIRNAVILYLKSL